MVGGRHALFLGATLLLSCTPGQSISTTPTSHPTLNPSLAKARLLIVRNLGREPKPPTEIDAVNADGSGRVRLTSDSSWNISPAWSPDGKTIVYTTTRDDPENKTFQIYVMNADGSNPRRLTNGTQSALFPAWAPDGQHIIFEGIDNGIENLYEMNADGTGRRLFLSTGSNLTAPRWSPDGKLLAFSMWGGSQQQVYTVKADGTDLRLLTTVNKANLSPTWSPDGAQIAYGSSPDNHRHIFIYVMNKDGSGQRKVTNGPLDILPSWSPDGAITFSRLGRLYLIRPDGTGLTVLIDDGTVNTESSWFPALTTANPVLPA